MKIPEPRVILMHPWTTETERTMLGGSGRLQSDCTVAPPGLCSTAVPDPKVASFSSWEAEPKVNIQLPQPAGCFPESSLWSCLMGITGETFGVFPLEIRQR